MQRLLLFISIDSRWCKANFFESTIFFLLNWCECRSWSLNFEHYHWSSTWLFIIFALTTIAVLIACDSSLVALAIFLLAVRFPAVASSCMLNRLYYLPVWIKCLGISHNYHITSMLSLMFMTGVVKASVALTILSTDCSVCKAFAVELQALGFLATASLRYFVFS